jgi:hypothetical protein
VFQLSSPKAELYNVLLSLKSATSGEKLKVNIEMTLGDHKLLIRFPPGYMAISTHKSIASQ